MVRPLTEPHGWKTVSGVTTPVGRSGTVVVVSAGLDGVVELLPELGVVVEIGGNVVIEPSGLAATTFSPPATQADARRASEERTRTALRISDECRDGPPILR